MKRVLICDIETYRGFFLIAFKRVSDGKIVTLELSDRSTIDLAKLRKIMLSHCIVTYNGNGYDIPLIWLCLKGATNAQLKRASDTIIKLSLRPWQIGDAIGVNVPRELDHIDLMEPQPNAFASLKTLNGRLHGRWMQDLPIDPDATLSFDDMDALTRYCINDLDATHLLYNALKEPLELRAAISKEYRFNAMSRSDSQIGEQVAKLEVQRRTGKQIRHGDIPAGQSFRYRPPEWLKFTSPNLIERLDRILKTDFYVKSNGKVDLPAFLSNEPITIGDTEYVMGIGGLHSTESERAVYADVNHFMRDADVASFYTAIILGSGLYPKALGKEFLTVYRKLRDDRIVAKKAGNRTKAEGLKISLNGIFGKLGSPYSVLYAPHLLITVTITGQLLLLMFIEQAEAAGISVVSANTDGVVFRCRRDHEATLVEVCRQWEADTGFDLEYTDYDALYSASVNGYIAVKPDGSTKRKGLLSNPRAASDMRGQLMKNPNAVVCSDAVVAHLTTGRDIEDYIRSCRDVRDFVTVVNVNGGGTWKGEYLGKVVRYYWATDGAPILYKTPNPTTGHFKQVSKTSGSAPLMTLPDEIDDLPDDIDYDRYIYEAQEILMDIGAVERPVVVKPMRVTKANYPLFVAAVL